MSRPDRDPIAIVGIGCRFPGGARDPESFWNLLKEGVDAVGEIPSGRVGLAPYYAPGPGRPGKMMSRHGGFLDDIDRFDANFFGISPREAERLDPQQRLLLEIAWEALEDAGQVAETLSGSQAGVFIGLWLNDFEARLSRYPEKFDFYMTTGSGRYAASGRLSYFLGFQGPSLTVDTHCSSSLVAVHLACQSLWSGECSLALAGGANIILQPHISIAYSQSEMISRHGRCQFGDAAADGYVRSEGAGIVVLKPLSAAVSDGDRVYAVISGAAINNDGRSSGYLTTPAVHGQEQLLQRALTHAGIQPGDIAFVEAHGAGTGSGDPVEIEALGKILSQGGRREHPCALGSVKTNIGHTEAAAGIAGLIKAALSIHHRAIPPSLHFNNPNPKIPWKELPVYVPTELRSLPENGKPLYAGVSSFGITGANAHVILSEAPGPPHAGGLPERPQASHNLLLLSARTEAALQALARSYLQFLGQDPLPPFRDICFTSRSRRAHHEYRLAISARDAAEASASLVGFLNKKDRPNVFQNYAASLIAPRLVFVFPGQGSQWTGMGRELLDSQPVFRDSLMRFDRAMLDFAGWSVVEQMRLDPQDKRYRMHHIDILQPVLLALEIGLAELWLSWGVRPHAVIGHSLGEIGAAYIAGVLDLQDAVRVICQRSRLLNRISGKGGMAVVGLPVEQVLEEIEDREAALSVAASNSRRSTVIAGAPAALEGFLATLADRNVFCRRVDVDVAAHSPQVEPLREELARVLDGLSPRPGHIPIYSTASGSVTYGADFGAEYWGMNLRNPVVFSEMTERLLEDGYNIFLELSPHPILSTPIEETVDRLEKQALTVSSLRRDEGEMESLLGGVGSLYTTGYPVDFDKVFPEKGAHVRLPSYPWQRVRYWLDELMGEPARQGHASGELRNGEVAMDWFYDVNWVHKPQSPVAENRLVEDAGHWLIFADRDGVAGALARKLQAAGQTITLLYRKDGDRTPVPGGLPVETGDPQAFARVLEQVPPEKKSACRGVLYLWDLDIDPVPQDGDLAALLEDQQVSCSHIISLVQRLVEQGWPEQTKLWLATLNAQPLPQPSGESEAVGLAEAPLALTQALTWGLGRTIALEQPERWGGLVDLPAGVEANVAAGYLFDELQNSDGEDQILYRDGRRFAARLDPVAGGEVEMKPFAVHGDATYLITGGLGLIGLSVARWLVERGARHLVLVSRSGVPDRDKWGDLEAGSRDWRRVQALQALEASGANLTIACLDVSDSTQMAGLFAGLRESGAAVKGVLHAAGVFDYRSILDLDPQSIEPVLKPKVAGAWLLHEQARDLDLDFFVLCSSSTAVLGSRGLPVYAAGNAFLDNLAHFRIATGLPALSVNWGWWVGDRLDAAEVEITNLATHSGVRQMQAERAIAALEVLLKTGAAQKVVADLDWSIAKPLYESHRRRPLLAHIKVEKQAFPLEGDDFPKSDLLEKLARVSKNKRVSLLQAHIGEHVKEILGLDPSDPIDIRQGFFKLGLDSLMSMQLHNRLEASFNISWPTTVALEYPSIATLADYIAGEVLPLLLGENLPAGQPSAETGVQPPVEAGPDLSEITGQELMGLLDGELSKINDLLEGD